MVCIEIKWKIIFEHDYKKYDNYDAIEIKNVAPIDFDSTSTEIYI